jgi:kynurenine formamidase
MPIVDLSVPLRPRADDRDFVRIEIDYADHAAGAMAIEKLFGVGPELLRDSEGWAVDAFKHLSTHATTHVDAPWHYNSTIGGQPAKTIDQLPLEWFYGPGVVLDFQGRADGEAIGPDELHAALSAAGHGLAPRDIVLIRTGRDEFYESSDYPARGPGVSAEGTRWLYDRGIRVMGVDAWGWDRPLHMQAEEALAARRPGIFWAAHQADLEYCQIERLANLHALPATGFTVACFPLKLVGGSAAPARVVAIVPDGATAPTIP